MAEAHTKKHDYHLVEPSPWPFLGAVGALIMALGAIGLMKWNMGEEFTVLGLDLTGWGVFAVGLLIILYTMFGWWRDTIREGHQGHHTRVVSLHLRYGMIMFIASEVMFFVAWFWAYFDAALFTGEAIQFARVEATGGALAAGRHRHLRPLAPAAPQHADPADLRHDGDLGAPRPAARRPPGPQVGA